MPTRAGQHSFPNDDREQSTVRRYPDEVYQALAEIEGLLRNLRRVNQSRRDGITAIRANFERWSSQLDQLVSEWPKMREELAAIERENATFKAEHATFKAEHAQLKEVNVQLQKDNERIAKKIEECEKSIQSRLAANQKEKEAAVEREAAWHREQAEKQQSREQIKAELRAYAQTIVPLYKQFVFLLNGMSRQEFYKQHHGMFWKELCRWENEACRILISLESVGAPLSEYTSLDLYFNEEQKRYFQEIQTNLNEMYLESTSKKWKDAPVSCSNEEKSVVANEMNADLPAGATQAILRTGVFSNNAAKPVQEDFSKLRQLLHDIEQAFQRLIRALSRCASAESVEPEPTIRPTRTV